MSTYPRLFKVVLFNCVRCATRCFPSASTQVAQRCHVQTSTQPLPLLEAWEDGAVQVRAVSLNGAIASSASHRKGVAAASRHSSTQLMARRTTHRAKAYGRRSLFMSSGTPASEAGLCPLQQIATTLSATAAYHCTDLQQCGCTPTTYQRQQTRRVLERRLLLTRRFLQSHLSGPHPRC